MIQTKEKLRGIVRNVLSQSYTPNLESPEFEYLFDATKTIPFRFFWFTTIALCLGVCSYQITDRINWYLSYPIAVDITVDRLKPLEVFEAQFVSPETDYLFEIPIQGAMLLMKNTEYHIFPFVDLLGPQLLGSIDFNKLWNFENQPKIIDKVEVDESINKSLSYHSYPTIFGGTMSVDLGAHIISPVKIFVETKSRRLRYAVAILNPMNDFRRGVWFMLRKCFIWNIAFTKFTRIRTRHYHCVETRQFSRCYIKCMARILQTKAVCKFPPHDVFNVTLPLCTTEFSSHSYYLTLDLHLKPDFYGECKCIEPCRSTRFAMTMVNDLECPSDITRMTLKPDEYEMLFNQRIAYDEISLLTDIGGNLCLFLGLTLLSILYNIQQLMIFWRKHWTNSKTTPKNTIHDLVIKQSQWCKDEKSSMTINNQKYSLIKIFKAIVWVICTGFVLFMLQDRIRLYFQYPVRLIVTLVKQDKVILPSLTICAVSDDTYSRKLHFAQKNNITNWSDVHLLDVVEYEKEESLIEVWKNSLRSPMLDYRETLVKVTKINAPTPDVTYLMTPEGYCMHNKFSGDKYEGFLSLYLVVFFVQRAQEMNAPFLIFTADPESDSFDILTRSEIFYHLVTFYEFSLQQYTRLNTAFRPCVEKTTRDHCKQQCFTQYLQEARLCRLPFFPSNINATECKSAKEAKESHRKYVTILARTSNGRVCNCYNRLCTETILTRIVSTQESPYFVVFETWFGLSDNTVENIVEVELYSLVALFCDIGNNLGVALGMSLLTIVNFSRQAFSASSTYLKLDKLF